MTITQTAYEACGDLFSAHPDAVTVPVEGVHCMALRAQGRRYVLAWFPGASTGPHYGLSPWGSTEQARIAPGAEVPGWVSAVLASAVPLPAEG